MRYENKFTREKLSRPQKTPTSPYFPGFSPMIAGPLSTPGGRIHKTRPLDEFPEIIPSISKNCISPFFKKKKTLTLDNGNPIWLPLQT